MPQHDFRIGQRVALSQDEGAFIGKVEEVDGDKVRVDWNGGELVASAVGNWIRRDRLRPWNHRGLFD